MPAKKKAKSASRKRGTRRAAARKSSGRKSASRKSATKKSATRKSAAKKSGGRKAAARGRAVVAAVESKARQGLEAAKGGFEFLKDTTTHLVEEVKDRIGS
jgi:RNA polymerase primary sigma factor